MLVKTNRSTLHRPTVYTTYKSLSRKIAATTRFSSESTAVRNRRRQVTCICQRSDQAGGPLPRKHSPDGATKAR